jgi:hypothetical protein
VSPNPASPNVLDSAFGNAIALRADRYGFCSCPDAAHVVIGKLRSLAPEATAAFRHIAHVFDVRTKIKVLGVYAKAVVAAMKNPLAGGNRRSVDGPRKTVRLHRPTICNDSSVGLLARLGFCDRTDPLPAPGFDKLPAHVEERLQDSRLGSLKRILDPLSLSSKLVNPLRVVVVAHATRLHEFAAVLDGADVSHSSYFRGYNL